MSRPAPSVLHVVDAWHPVSSGYVTRTRQIVSHQRRLGVAVPHLLVSSRQFAYGAEPASDGLDGVQATQVPASHSERRLRRARRWHVDAEHLAEAVSGAARACDIVHVHGASALGRAAARGAAAAGKPLVAEMRYDLAGAVSSETFRGALRPFEGSMRRRFNAHLARADAIVCASEAIRPLVDRGAARRITTVPNGVDVDLFGSVPLQRREGRPLIVGTTAFMLRYEGLACLIEAVKDLGDVRLRLVGGGPQRAALQKLALAHGVDAEFVPQQPFERVPTILEGLDVFVVPRLDRTITRYASPIKLIEAMAAGRPVVASDVGDMAALLAEGRGLLARPGDPRSLRDAIVRLRDDEDHRLAIGERARVHVAETRRWEHIIPRYAEVYEEVTR